MTKIDDKRVPALRFKGFNDDWAQRKFNEIGSFYYGKSAPKWSIKGNGNIPCVRYGEMYTKFEPKIDHIYSYTTIDPKKLKFSSGHELLIPRVGEDPLDFGKHCSWLAVPNVAIGEMISVFNSKENPLFLAYYIRAKLVYKFASRVEGGNVSNLYFERLEKLALNVPATVEQEKIVRILEKLNNLLSLQQRKAQQLKLLKKAMMQDLFNDRDIPKLRFSGFKDNWSNVNLGEIGKATGGTPLESEFIKNGSYKVISIGSYTENHKYNNQGMRVNLNRKTKKRIMNKDDLAMILNDKTKSGKIIGSVLLISDNDSFVYNQRTERIEPNHDKFSSQFLFQYLNANTIRNKIVSNAQGNTQIYVNWSSISKINYLIPSIDEQKRIGKLLFSLDSIIDIQQGKIEKYYKVKHFLLQNMFI